MQAFFESQGLKFTGDGIIGNTFNSHRLVIYAGQQNLAKQTEVMGLLFKAAFVDVRRLSRLRPATHAISTSALRIFWKMSMYLDFGIESKAEGRFRCKMHTEYEIMQNSLPVVL